MVVVLRANRNPPQAALAPQAATNKGKGYAPSFDLVKVPHDAVIRVYDEAGNLIEKCDVCYAFVTQNCWANPHTWQTQLHDSMTPASVDTYRIPRLLPSFAKKLCF